MKIVPLRLKIEFIKMKIEENDVRSVCFYVKMIKNKVKMSDFQQKSFDFFEKS